MDLVIRDARLRPGTRAAVASSTGVDTGTGDTAGGDVVDVGIADGRITAIGPTVAADPDTEVLDAEGGLVTESFVDAHLHLDKVFTASVIGDEAFADYHTGGMTSAADAIDTAATVKLGQDPDSMLDAGRRVLAMAAFYGTTDIRALADVDTKAGLRGVEALCSLRDEFAADVQVQVVAFAQDGIIREAGTDELLARAMELGADVVGGIPWIEADEAAMAAHCDVVFDIAAAFDAPISMLLDDVGDPACRTLEMMARRAVDRGWHGRALAHHARAMSLYPDDYFASLVPLLVEAGVAVVSDPHTGPLHARVSELLEAGVTVCLGQDDISDAYYAFGRENMLEVAFLAAHLLWSMDAAGREMVFDAVTIAAADALGLEGRRLAVGAPAHLVVLPVADTLDALRFHPAPAAVIRGGRVLDRNRYRTLAAVPDRC